MIPRLHSQIKTMSGRELASELLTIVRHREREFTINLGGESIGVDVYSGNPVNLLAALARIIDDIRMADKA